MGVLKIESWEDFDLVSVDVSFVGRNHLVIEENQGFVRRSSIGGEEMENSPPKSVTGSSPPDRVTSDLYQYFANRTSPGWERAYRRHRRKERQRQGRRLWEPEHYVKIVNASPTPARPLQGLWKVIWILLLKFSAFFFFFLELNWCVVAFAMLYISHWFYC